MIGICVLTLNSEATVGHAIKSILKQRPPKDEVFFVVVDGGSRDRTIEIVNEVLRGLSYELISAPGSNIPQGFSSDVGLYWLISLPHLFPPHSARVFIGLRGVQGEP
ncbi:MAG: glycosyltransferase [Sulfolobales archaeon]